MKATIKPSGINHDINPAELPPDVWNFGSNVLFPNGYAGAAPGWVETAPGMICEPVWLLPVLAEPLYYWIYAGNNDAGSAGVLGVTDGTTHWDITPAGGLNVTKAGDWTGGVLNGIPVMNNPLDPPMYWDRVPTNVALELPGWPVDTLCQALRPFKYHLIAMGIEDGTGDFPDLVIWSDAADPGTIPQSWTPQPDNQAGNFTISTTPGGIIDGGAMRDQFMVYKQHSSSVMQFIAGQFVFANRKAFVTSGILARNCYAEMYGSHYVLTDGDFIRHNGQEVQSLIDGVNRAWLFGQIDSNNFSACHLALSHDQKQVWINWPKAGHVQCDTALVYDIVSSAYGVVDYDEDIAYMTRGILNKPGQDNSFDARTDTFDEAPDRYNSQLYNPTTDVLVFCRMPDKKMYGMEGYIRDGAPVPIFLQMLSKDLGESAGLKLITAVWPLAETDGIDSGTLRMRVGTQLKIRDSITWSAEVLSGDDLKMDFMASGRFISLELTGSQVARWRLNSLDIHYEQQGAW